jgi:hypothetical protein
MVVIVVILVVVAIVVARVDTVEVVAYLRGWRKKVLSYNKRLFHSLLSCYL